MVKFLPWKVGHEDSQSCYKDKFTAQCSIYSEILPELLIFLHEHCFWCSWQIACLWDDQPNIFTKTNTNTKTVTIESQASFLSRSCKIPIGKPLFEIYLFDMGIAQIALDPSTPQPPNLCQTGKCGKKGPQIILTSPYTPGFRGKKCPRPLKQVSTPPLR